MSEITRAYAPKNEKNRENLVSRKPNSNLSYSLNMDSPEDQILHLQRTIGNQAVTRLIQSGVIQAKPAAAQSNDLYEQEAEAAAEQVIKQPGTGVETLPGMAPHAVRVVRNTPGPTIIQKTEKTPVELSETEIQAEISRLEAELITIDPVSPEWSRVYARIDALRQEQMERLLYVRWTGIPQLEITSPSQDDIFYIDTVPRMPNIPCRALVRGITPDPTSIVPFDWQLTIVETVRRGGCASSRIGECRLPVEGTRIQGGDWTPNFGNTIQGGDAVLTARAAVHGEQLTAPAITLHIRGTNPAAAEVSARAGGAGSTADQIACNESRRTQFDNAGMPLLGPGGDTGVMQFCTPAATCGQRWDWTANVDGGVALLGAKRAAARNYLNRHRVDGHYPNDQGYNDARVLLLETIKRYNQGHYWEWNSTTNQWEVNPDPPNNYVAHVLGCR
jgi:hypothetical protein